VARAVEADEPGVSAFVARTASVDRVGDSIDQGTWRLASYRANPVILYEHGDPVIGRSRRVGVSTEGDAKQLRIEVQWDTDPSNPRGILAAHQHEAGFRRAVSVGFYPGKRVSRASLAPDHPLYVDPKAVPEWRAGSIYSYCELLEVSSVAVPANRDALQLSLSARQAAADGADLVTVARTLLGQPPAALDLPTLLRDPAVRAEIRALVYGATPAPAPTPTTSGIRWVARS
jgi:phage head maturation protease